MKRLSGLLILLLVGFWSQSSRAQAADSWDRVSLKGDELTVWMPTSRQEKSREFSFDQFKLSGRVYTATSEGVDISLWSLVDEHGADKGQASEAYLDACADLVWESLLKPQRDALPQEVELKSRMSYGRELLMDNLPPGREYEITLGGRRGLTRFFVAERTIYALIVLDLNTRNVAAAQRFVFSFGPKKEAPPSTDHGYGSGGGGIGFGGGTVRGGNIGGDDSGIVGSGTTTVAGETDYNRVFTGRDVTQKARITSKPEPQYTNSARKYNVQGTVILRAVFARTGEVNNIKVVGGLPHGLTERAVMAAREMKFTPAIKDGHEVAMYIQLEYNFNLY